MSSSSSPSNHPPPPSFSRLLKDKFDREILVHPSNIRQILDTTRTIREQGVRTIMDTIHECGWAPSTLYASDRGNNEPPVLIEGNHRVEALRRLLLAKKTSWLLPGETPENFKVKVTVLKGLSIEEESRIGREANHVNANYVPMTLVDHIVAMDAALRRTRLRKKLSPHAPISMAVLLSSHPDYQRYHNSTIRGWKRIAEGLGPKARSLLLRTHDKGLDSGDEVRLVFSKKTLVESNMMYHLRDLPGMQYCYFKRLLHMGRQEQIREHKAPFFQDMVVLLKDFAYACQNFASSMENTFNLPRVAWLFRGIVKEGYLPENPELLEPKPRESLETFIRHYLYTLQRDDETKILLEKRTVDYSLYPFVFYEIVAEFQFKSNYDDFNDALAKPEANLWIKFTSPVDPSQHNKGCLQILRDRKSQLLQSRKRPSTSAPSESPPQKKKKTNPHHQPQDEHPGDPPTPIPPTPTPMPTPSSSSTRNPQEQDRDEIHPTPPTKPTTPTSTPQTLPTKPSRSTTPSSFHTSTITIHISENAPDSPFAIQLRDALIDYLKDTNFKNREKIRLVTSLHNAKTKERVFPKPKKQ